MDARRALLHQIGRNQAASYRELMVACRISSTSVVAYYLRQLEKSGLIERHFARARSLKLTPQGKRLIAAERLASPPRKTSLARWKKRRLAPINKAAPR